MVILEEASSIPSKVLETIIVPMLLMRQTATLCISTVLGNENAYSKLMDKADPRTGKTHFLPVRVSLRCTDPTCGAVNELCWHVAYLVPGWHMISSHDTARDLLSGSQATRDRELMGITSDEGTKQFPPELVDAAFAWPTPRSSSGRAKFVVISVDPNNCGTSNYAIVSAAYTNDSMVILGMDTTTAGDVEVHERLFATHVRMLERVIEGLHVYLAVEG